MIGENLTFDLSVLLQADFSSRQRQALERRAETDPDLAEPRRRSPTSVYPSTLLCLSSALCRSAEQQLLLQTAPVPQQTPPPVLPVGVQEQRIQRAPAASQRAARPEGAAGRDGGEGLGR